MIILQIMRNFLSLLILSVLTFLTACQQPPQEQRLTVEYYNSPVNAARNVPYSEAVKVGQTLYLAGKLGMKDGKLAQRLMKLCSLCHRIIVFSPLPHLPSAMSTITTHNFFALYQI